MLRCSFGIPSIASLTDVSCLLLILLSPRQVMQEDSYKMKVVPRWHWVLWTEEVFIEKWKKHPGLLKSVLNDPEKMELQNKEQSVYMVGDGEFNCWHLYPRTHEIEVKTASFMERGLIGRDSSRFVTMNNVVQRAMEQLSGSGAKAGVVHMDALRAAIEATDGPDISEDLLAAPAFEAAAPPSILSLADMDSAAPVFGFGAAAPVARTAPAHRQVAPVEVEDPREKQLRDKIKESDAHSVHLASGKSRTVSMQVRTTNSVASSLEAKLLPCFAAQMEIAIEGNQMHVAVVRSKDLVKVLTQFRHGLRVPHRKHLNDSLREMNAARPRDITRPKLPADGSGLCCGQKLAPALGVQNLDVTPGAGNDHAVFHYTELQRREPFSSWPTVIEVSRLATSTQTSYQLTFVVASLRGYLEWLQLDVPSINEKRERMVRYCKWFRGLGARGFAPSTDQPDLMTKLTCLLQVVSLEPGENRMTSCGAIAFSNKILEAQLFWTFSPMSPLAICSGRQLWRQMKH